MDNNNNDNNISTLSGNHYRPIQLGFGILKRDEISKPPHIFEYLKNWTVKLYFNNC